MWMRFTRALRSLCPASEISLVQVEDAQLILIQGNCVTQSYLNKPILEALYGPMKIRCGLVRYKGTKVYGDGEDFITISYTLDMKATQTLHGHCWLEGEDGTVYDIATTVHEWYGVWSGTFIKAPNGKGVFEYEPFGDKYDEMLVGAYEHFRKEAGYPPDIIDAIRMAIT